MKITFKIHFLFFIVSFLCFMTGLFKDFVVFTSIIFIHELGHIVTGLLFKWKIDKVIIFPFGGLTIFNQKINTSSLEEFIIAIAGIAFQTIFLLLLNTNNYLFIKYYKIILFFNILPIYPLDGSKVLNIFLNKIFPFKKSYILTILISLITIFTFFIVMIDNFNLLLFLSIMLLLTKLFNYYKDIDIIWNKFLFERYLYKIKYKKIKKINNISKMFKEKTHVLFINNNIIKEEDFLSKMFDRRKNL